MDANSQKQYENKINCVSVNFEVVNIGKYQFNHMNKCI